MNFSANLPGVMVYGSGLSPLFFIKEQDSPAKKKVQRDSHRPQQLTVDPRLLSPCMALSKLPLRSGAHLLWENSLKGRTALQAGSTVLKWVG